MLLDQAQGNTSSDSDIMPKCTCAIEAEAADQGPYDADFHRLAIFFSESFRVPIATLPLTSANV